MGRREHVLPRVELGCQIPGGTTLWLIGLQMPLIVPYLQRKKKPGRGLVKKQLKKLFLNIYFLK